MKRKFRILGIQSFIFLFLITNASAFPHGNNNSIGFNAGFEYFPSDNFKEKIIAFSGSFPVTSVKGFNISNAISFSNSAFNDNLNIGNLHSINNLRDLGCEISVDNDKYSFSAGINSASNRLFNSIRETSFNLTSMYKYKKNNNSTWMFGFSFNSKDENKFFPIIAYSYQTENFIAMFPMMCMYNISDKWFLKLAGEGFNGFDLSLNYRKSTDLTISACANMTQKKYYLIGRQNKNESLRINKNSAGIKIEKNIFNFLTSGFYLGRSFSSKYVVEDFDNKYDKLNFKNAVLLKTWFSVEM